MLVLCWLALVGIDARAQADCGMRYLEAGRIAQAALGSAGTPYAGGNHFGHLDHVGATVDLYRLWRGHPDLKFRGAHDWTWVDIGIAPEAVAATLRDGLRLMTEAAPAGTPEEHYVALVKLDLLTPVSTTPAWWTQPVDEGVAPRSAAVAREAATSEPLEWLLLLAAASHAGWTLDPDSRRADAAHEPQFAALSQEARSRHVASGGLEWLVAAAALAPPGSDAANALRGERDALGAMVLACEASPAQFAAWLVLVASSGELPADRATFALLPEYSATWLVDRHLRFAADAQGFRGGEHVARLQALGASPAAMEMAGVAAVYFAEDLQAIETGLRGVPWSGYTLRALNVLSAAQLEQLSASENFTGEQRALLATAAFARHLALGRMPAAQRLLPALRAAWPASAGEIAALEDLRLPDPVRLSLVALALPRVTTWLQPPVDSVPPGGDFALLLRHSRFRRELPADMADGSFLVADYETWLRLPNRWGRLKTMRGMQYDELQRHLQRERLRAWSIPARAIPTPPLPLQQWMARDELRRLGAGGALTTALARVLLACAEDPPFAWFGSDCRGAAMATGLQRLIELARREDEPLLDGQPVGRRAFRILQREMGDTAAAQATRYWHY